MKKRAAISPREEISGVAGVSSASLSSAGSSLRLRNAQSRFNTLRLGGGQQMGARWRRPRTSKQPTKTKMVSAEMAASGMSSVLESLKYSSPIKSNSGTQVYSLTWKS